MMILHPMIIILLLFSCATEASEQPPKTAHAQSATADSVPALADTAIGMDTNLAQATTTSIDTVPEDIYLRSVTIDGMAQPLFLKPKELVRLWDSNQKLVVKEVTKGVFGIKDKVESRKRYFYKYLEFYSPSGVLMERLDIRTLNYYYDDTSIKRVYDWYDVEGGREFNADSLGRFDEVFIRIVPFDPRGDFDAAVKVRIYNGKLYQGSGVAECMQIVYLDSNGRIIWDSGPQDDLVRVYPIEQNTKIIANYSYEYPKSSLSGCYISEITEWPKKRRIPFVTDGSLIDPIGDDLVIVTLNIKKERNVKQITLYRLSTSEKLYSIKVNGRGEAYKVIKALHSKRYTAQEAIRYMEQAAKE